MSSKQVNLLNGKLILCVCACVRVRTCTRAFVTCTTLRPILFTVSLYLVVLHRIASNLR